jgi:hypothetical protein
VRARLLGAGLLVIGMIVTMSGGGETGASPIWKKGTDRHGGARIERPIGVPIGGYPQTYKVPDNGLSVTD